MEDGEDCDPGSNASSSCCDASSKRNNSTPAKSTPLIFEYVSLKLVNSCKAQSAIPQPIFAAAILVVSLVIRLYAERQRMKHVTWRNIALEAQDHVPKMRLGMMVSTQSVPNLVHLRHRQQRADKLANPTGLSCGSNGLACASGQCTSKDCKTSLNPIYSWELPLINILYSMIAVQCQTVGSALNLTRGCSQKGDTSCVVSCQSPDSA